MTMTAVLAHNRRVLAALHADVEHACRARHKHALVALLALLAALLRQLEQARSQGDLSPSWLYEAARLEGMLHAVQREIDAFAASAEALTEHAQRQGIQAGREAAARQLRTLTGGNLSPVAPDTLPQPGKTDGGPLSRLFRGYGKEAATGVKAALTIGVALALPIARITANVTGALMTSLWRGLTVLGDQLQRAYRATVGALMRGQDAVLGWRWRCAFDNSCIACIMMHGTVHAADEELDDHPRGHCEQEWLTADSPDIQSGQDWFDAQDAATQEAALGSHAAYDLYQSGTPLSDFVGYSHSTTWGTAIRRKSVKELTAATP